MTENTLPAEVIQEDRRLDEMASTAKTALAELRWHWTLDETNPGRVSFREYGRQCERAHVTIHDMAHGYVSWKESQVLGLGLTPDASWSTLDDCIVRQRSGATRVKAAEILADSTNRRPASILKNSASDVTQLIAQATDAATRRDTDVEHEMERIVEFREKARRADATAKAKREADRGLEWIKAEGYLHVAMKNVRLALEMDLTFDGEERELLADTLGKLRAAVHLLDLKIVGTTDIDWDAELTKIGDTK